ncbi:MAG: nucleotidyltransferase domain-containing protein [bacterium]|nr:nucleotidyltransferase domain-containing protein [bacterium]
MPDPAATIEDTMDEVVNRIVQSVQPRRIVLFGSAATGHLGPSSDIDLLVIMTDGVHRRRTVQAIYRSLIGTGVATDVVVATESDLREHGDNPSLVFFPALREGRELYRAAG